MKQTRLAVAGLVLLVLAGASAAGANTSSDADFLQSLGQVVEFPAVPEGPSSNGAPPPTLKACSVSRDCGDGNTVACTGTSSCVYSLRGVKCDSNEVTCPNVCTMGWMCPCGQQKLCTSLRGDCGVTNEGCDGRPRICIC